jgi:hypothetical protein
MNDASAPRDPAAARRAKRTLLLIAAVCIAPVVASYAAYYLFPRDTRVNYGTLLPTAPAPAIEGARPDGTPFRLADLAGRWLVVVNAGGGCDAACGRALYATRQARTMQGKDADRVVRVWLVTDDAPPAATVLADHPGLVVARVPADRAARLPGGPDAIVLVDPLGNLVLRYPLDPDVKGLARDLGRLLRASGIG